MNPTARRLRGWVETLMFLVMMAMVALTFADVVGRRLFGKPVFGAHDMTEHLMAVMVFCGLPLVTAAAGHLTVDLLDKIILRPGLRWWRGLIVALTTAIFLLISWLFLMQAFDAAEISEVSQGLNLPRAPLYGFMAICSALSAGAAILAGLHGPMRSEAGEAPKEAL